MLAVQPRSHSSSDKKLAAVSVRTSISHRKQTRLSVFHDEVFVGKFFAVDGFSAGSVVSGEVTALAHELRDNTVKNGVGVAEAFFAGAH